MLAIITTILAGASIAIVRLRNAIGHSLGTPTRKPTRRFRAVSIVPADGITCCRVCDALRHRRALLRDAPKLPIAGCLAPDCSCRYRHHRDRREFNPGRRLRDIGNFQSLFAGCERRLWDLSRRRRPGRRRFARA